MKIEKHGNYNKVEDLIKDSVTNTNKNYQFDVKNAPDIITKALVKGERLTVIGDYDCDGICASAIMFKGLNRLKELFVGYTALTDAEKAPLISLVQRAYGVSSTEADKMLAENAAVQTKVRIRLPHRYTEGYGMRDTMVDEISSGVLITVDNGIAAASAIKKATDKGLDVILTDHHSLPVIKSLKLVNDELCEVNEYVVPAPTCLINPHVEETMHEPGHYDFYDYCGAGVALKLMESVLPPNDKILDKLYAFAAIATVADVMPMIEDNRNIFKRGVQAMRDGDVTPGLAALISVSKLNVNNLPDDMPSWALFSSDVMGFNLGPKINAPGRVGTDNPASMGGDRGAERSLRCLLEEDPQNAMALATELNDSNEFRKEISREMQMRCETIIAQRHMENDCPLLVHIPECGSGVIGLVAGYLCEKYKVPALVFNGSGEKCKGSARSPEGINIKELLDDCQSVITAYGGHPGAAGLTVSEEKLDKLREMLYNDCIKKGYHSLATDTVQYDLEIDASEIEHNAHILLETLAPFGEQNNEPTFLVRNFVVREDPTILGEKHIKLAGNGAAAIGFSLAEDKSILEHFENNRVVDLIGTLGFNCFRGNATPQLTIQFVVDGDEIVRDEDELETEELEQE